MQTPLPSREVEPHGSSGSTPCPLALLRADSHSGSCTARFLLSKDVTRSVVEHRPALGEAALSIIDFPPETGQCAGARDHRPALGDLLLLERGIGRFYAQRLGLGEIGWFGRGMAAAFLQVGALALLAGSPKAGSCAGRSLPSKDVVSGSPVFLAERSEFLPSRDDVSQSRPIVSAWERLAGSGWEGPRRFCR